MKREKKEKKEWGDRKNETRKIRRNEIGKGDKGEGKRGTWRKIEK